MRPPVVVKGLEHSPCPGGVSKRYLEGWATRAHASDWRGRVASSLRLGREGGARMPGDQMIVGGLSPLNR